MEIIKRPYNDNPFYGMRNTLLLFQALSSGKAVSASQLNSAYAECDTREKKELFYSIIFSIGDITARQHNIFRGHKKDNGGFALRDVFYSIFQWLKRDKEQFLAFLKAKLFTEYIGFDLLFGYRIRTEKKKSKEPKVTRVFQPFNGDNPEEITIAADFAATIIKSGSDEEKRMLAKFLSRPRFSPRKGHKKILDLTKMSMRYKATLLTEISERCSFEILQTSKYTVHKGYYEWRRAYIQEGINMLESYAFSSGKVRELDEQGFYAWLEAMPASARFRVRKRLLDKDNKPKSKWGENLPQWFLNWEKFKKEKQAEQRVLEEKVRQGTITEKEVEKLKEVRKEAKTTVGAVNFQQLFAEIITGNVDEVKIQPFLDKISLPYNTLVFVDDSGSMSSYGTMINGKVVSAFDFASFLAAICLMKNPDDSGRNLLGLFSQTTRIFSSIEAMGIKKNSILNSTETVKISLPLHNPELTFLENLHNLRGFMHVNKTGQITNISSIPEALHAWAGGDSERIEQLMNFPVWTIITDGNWNNLHSPEHSMNDFMGRCQKYFGYKPYIVAIDVCSSPVPVDRFAGIENMIVVSPNPASIEQFLTNFNDMDIMDVYQPLLALHRSNRYEPIRKAVL